MDEHHYTLTNAYREVASQALHIFRENLRLTLDDRAELHSWASEYLPVIEQEIDRINLPTDVVTRHLAFDLHFSKNY